MCMHVCVCVCVPQAVFAHMDYFLNKNITLILSWSCLRLCLMFSYVDTILDGAIMHLVHPLGLHLVHEASHEGTFHTQMG